MSPCVCGEDEECTVKCEKHDRVLHGYPCGACQAEWREANPHTAAAITKIASGRASLSLLSRAKRLDRESKHE